MLQTNVVLQTDVAKPETGSKLRTSRKDVEFENELTVRCNWRQFGLYLQLRTPTGVISIRRRTKFHGFEETWQLLRIFKLYESVISAWFERDDAQKKSLLAECVKTQIYFHLSTVFGQNGKTENSGRIQNWQTRVMKEELCSFSSEVWAISQWSYITLLHISFWMLVPHLKAVFRQNEFP